MALGSYIGVAGRSLAAYRLRTALAMLGVAAGVASLITMASLGEDARRSVQAQIQSLGTNLLSIRPRAGRAVRCRSGSRRGAGDQL